VILNKAAAGLQPQDSEDNYKQANYNSCNANTLVFADGDADYTEYQPQKRQGNVQPVNPPEKWNNSQEQDTYAEYPKNKAKH
jgi:hypothetical protein